MDQATLDAFLTQLRQSLIEKANSNESWSYTFSGSGNGGIKVEKTTYEKISVK